MSYFTSDFIAFFEDLSDNNNKSWFDQNRKRYEKSAKEPFNAFVEEMIVRIHKDNSDILIRPSEAIFRINRDIRFAKDKTPYKTHMAALISTEGRKARDFPGFYFQLGSSGIRIYSGVHQLQKGRLDQVRAYICNDLSMFEKVITEKTFQDHFNEILGEKNKRLPSEYKDFFDQQPLVANKDFYIMAELENKYITQPDLSNKLMEYYFAAKPLISYLTDALNS